MSLASTLRVLAAGFPVCGNQDKGAQATTSPTRGGLGSHRGGVSAFEVDPAGLSTRTEATGQVGVRLASPVGDQTLQLAYMPGLEVTGGAALVAGGAVQRT